MVTRVAVTTGAPAAATSFTPTLPAHIAGDRLLLVITGKDQNSQPTAPTGWTRLLTQNGGTGTVGTADSGPTFMIVYVKEATSSAETAPLITGDANTTSWTWVCSSHRVGTGKQWRDLISGASPWIYSFSDGTAASPLSSASLRTISGITANDAVFVVGNVGTDTGTALGAVTLTTPGLTGGTVTAATTQYVETTLGTDSAAAWVGWTGFTGFSTGELSTVSMVITGSTNHSGSLVLASFREEDPPPFNQIQSVKSSTYAGPGATCTLSTVVADEFLIAMFRYPSTRTFISITDNGGNTWVTTGSEVVHTNGYSSVVAWCVSPAAAATLAVSGLSSGVNGGTTYTDIFAAQYQRSGSALGKTLRIADTSASEGVTTLTAGGVSAGTVAVSSTPAVVIGAVCRMGGNGTLFTAGVPYDIQKFNAGTSDWTQEDAQTSVTGTYAPTFTAAGSGYTYTSRSVAIEAFVSSSGAPTARTITATKIDASTVDLNWAVDSAATPAPTYDIYKSTDGTNFTIHASAQNVTTGYTVAGLSAIPYWFRVVGVNAGGSATSNTVTMDLSPASTAFAGWGIPI